MGKKNGKVIILGAGISGLSTAFWLDRAGYDIMILEADGQPGGSVKTKNENGFLIDYGPNSSLETSPVIKELIDDAGLSNQMIYASEAAKNRYILKGDQLHPLPTNPLQFIKSELFSFRTKLRLLQEPFIKVSQEGCHQSIATFVKRRLGQQFLDYAIDPFVSGVFAGDPEKLSVQSAFPKLYQLEEKYGSLIKGMIKGAKERKNRGEASKHSAKMFSFIDGMATLPKALAEKLKSKIQYQCQVNKITSTPEGYQVHFQDHGKATNIVAGKVISTVPSYIAKSIFEEMDNQLAAHLGQIYYPPVLVLYLGYKKSDVFELDGFGFLIPRKEKKKFLGAIWNSTLFPARTGEDAVGFTLFIGGARNASILEGQDHNVLIKEVIKEFQQIMKINADPVYTSSKFWPNAIPQYNIGYQQHEEYFIEFEKKYPDLYLSGNYRGGISFGDCIKNSRILVDRIIIRGNR